MNVQKEVREWKTLWNDDGRWRERNS